MIDPIELIRELVALPAPPGQERAVHDWLQAYLRGMGFDPTTDARGNLLLSLGEQRADKPSVLVTAHMDEIAVTITEIEADGKVRVAAYGGCYPWKWGEGRMDILTTDGPLPAILSFGSMHSSAAHSTAELGRNRALTWDMTYLFTGMDRQQLLEAGVRPGLRAVLAQSRRVVTTMGPYIAAYFLDDRACLVAMLMALEALQREGFDDLGAVTFAATTSEELGCMGAKFILQRQPHDVCVALEIGPKTTESDFPIDAQPTIWVRDDTSALQAEDGELLERCCAELGQTPHWQHISKGGSDATRSATLGLTARPVTLGLPTENSHGFEIIHRDSPEQMARLLNLYLRRV